VNDAKIRIANFINGFLTDHHVGDDEDIFDAGYVNSLFVMQLVLMVEREFGIEVADTDLEIGNFNTVNAIANFVVRKQAVLSH